MGPSKWNVSTIISLFFSATEEKNDEERGKGTNSHIVAKAAEAAEAIRSNPIEYVNEASEHFIKLAFDTKLSFFFQKLAMQL